MAAPLGTVRFELPAEAGYRLGSGMGTLTNQMRYPHDFPPESRAAVAAEKLRAGKDFDEARENWPRTEHGFDLGAELRSYILRQFAVFVREACKLGDKGIWHVDYVENAVLEFIRLCTIEALSSKGHDRYGQGVGGNWISSWSGHIEPEVQGQLEKTGEWRQFRDALLQVAEGPRGTSIWRR